MIYANLPLKYQFVPMNINNEHFRITFCVFLLGYLKQAKEKWLDVMDEEDTNDGERIEIAENARDLHQVVEDQKDNIMMMREAIWGVEKLENYHTNINLDNCEFNYGDVSPDNVKMALDIFLIIARYHKYGYSKDEDEEEEEEEEGEEENN